MLILVFVAFALTVPLANWMIGHVGTVCIPAGPCLLPVGFGLDAPSGVYVIGAALILRDLLRELGGLKAVWAAITVGAVLSAVGAPPGLVLASALSFALAEAADALAYEPLRKRGLAVAVLVSGLAGAVVDSALFNAIAFGDQSHTPGQIVGKLTATVAVAALLSLRARRTA